MSAETGHLSRFTLKLLAAVFMLVNHAGHILVPEGTMLKPILIGLGCFSAPLMCRALVDGWQYTSDKKKYSIRLLIFGLVSELPFMLAFGHKMPFVPGGMNFLLTLFLGTLYLHFQEELTGSIYIRSVLFLFLAVSYFFDWGFLAPLFIIFFSNSLTDLTKEKCIWWFSAVLTAIASYESGPVGMAASFVGVAAAGLVRTIGYGPSRREERAVSTFEKYFFYIFYPLHLAVFVMLRGF